MIIMMKQRNTISKSNPKPISFFEQVKQFDKPFKRASLEERNGKSSTVFAETPNGFVAFSQNGSRNMQNFSLLKKLGTINKPILLKRGLAATIEDWLMAAEYILAAGNPNVILCERGIRTFDSKYTRNTLDLAAIPVLRRLTHLPIMIDPSHATGHAEYVMPMTKAAIIAGADSVMIEVHPNPTQALSDGPQSLTLEQYEQLMAEIPIIAQIVGRWDQQSSLSRHPCSLLGYELAA